MMLEAVFFYTTDSAVAPGNPSSVEFPIAVDMKFRANDDCCKKLITSVRSKALSYLGFGADVFMGKFDDEQYVAMVRTVGKDVGAFAQTAMAKVQACKNIKGLEESQRKTREMLADGIIDEDTAARLLEAIERRWLELEGGE